MTGVPRPTCAVLSMTQPPMRMTSVHRPTCIVLSVDAASHVQQHLHQAVGVGSSHVQREAAEAIVHLLVRPHVQK